MDEAQLWSTVAGARGLSLVSVQGEGGG